MEYLLFFWLLAKFSFDKVVSITRPYVTTLYPTPDHTGYTNLFNFCQPNRPKGGGGTCFILICISFIISEFLCLSLCLLAVCTSEPLTVILLFNLSLIRRIKNKNNTFPKTKSCSVNIQQILTVYGYGRRFWFWLLALLQCASLMTSYPAL